MDSSTPIADWLWKLGLSQYAETFAANKIGFDLLADLTNEDLRELGVQRAFGDRKRLLAEIAISMRVARAEPVPAGGSRATTHAGVSAGPRDRSCVRSGPAGTPGRLLGGTGRVATILKCFQTALSRTAETAEASTPAPPVRDEPTPSRRGFWARLFAGKFLLVSIIAHILFGLGATYFIDAGACGVSNL